MEMSTYSQSCERDLHIRIHQVSGLRSECVLQVRHDGGVHPGQTVCSVNPEEKKMHFL